VLAESRGTSTVFVVDPPHLRTSSEIELCTEDDKSGDDGTEGKAIEYEFTQEQGEEADKFN
jgi:hypothetical protein